MILLIDNYDSFSYNLYQLIGSVCEDILVIRNDEMSVSEIETMAPRLIVLSPGPGRPADAGICPKVVKTFEGKIPIFGVCLGHQVICEAFGAVVTYAKELMHGKTSVITVDTGSCLFRGFEGSCRVARYHSLAADRAVIPPELKVTGWTADGQVMAVEHKRYPVYGVQFHPESVLTERGAEMIKNLYGSLAV